MLIITGIILNIIGIIGVFLPALPGVVLNYAALVLLYISKKELIFSVNILFMFGFLTIIVTLLDYILPFLGAKKFGVSRSGIWGSLIGMIIGILFFPPLGMIFGLLIGAFLGELLAGKEQSQALRAGLVTFLGVLTSTVVKLVLALAMTIFYFLKIL
ncbi:MAG: DUF456 domain-containing protein [Atribacterota bacterium]|nr:DUF456 domain-containing protein [Atribacterota bacterium]